jgi:hypothetical protein
MTPVVILPSGFDLLHELRKASVVSEIFSRCTLRFRGIHIVRRCSPERRATALKLTYLLPLVISLTTAPEGCASLGLLSQSTVIVTKALLRLKNKTGTSISGFGSKLRHRTRPARALVG